MAFGSGFAGGFADGDNTTLAGSSSWLIAQTAALVVGMGIGGQTDWAVGQAASLGGIMTVGGQTNWIIGQSADLVLPLHDVSLAGATALTTGQSSNLIVVMALGGSCAWATSTPNASLAMLALEMAEGGAAIAILVSGTLFIIRPPAPPPSKIQEMLVRRRSFVMPVPSLGPSGRPS